MSRTALTFVLLFSAPALAAPIAPRDLGRGGHASVSFSNAPLHREALLGEIASGSRKLFAHDPKVVDATDPQNQFLIVRDRYVGAGSEHALGIFTPPGRSQPTHIREVDRKDAPHLGRMIRTLLFADRTSENAPAGGFSDWHVYVNMQPAVPRLHIHAQPANAPTEKITDFNAYAKTNGYVLHKSAARYKVWTWPGRGRAPHGWGVLAVGDAELGSQAALRELSTKRAAAVDRVIGDVWIEAAASSRGSQIETSRSDGQIVARSVGQSW